MTKAPTEMQCTASPTGKHVLDWDYEYIEPGKLYGLWEGGGRSLHTVHCRHCDYAGPYYPSHEPLMTEPCLPKGKRGASGDVGT